jgi:polyisoprenoid-binding protein YceI
MTTWRLDPGHSTVGFSVRDFLVWNVPMNAGGVLVGEEVKIDNELELAQAAAAPDAAPEPVLAGAA